MAHQALENGQIDARAGEIGSKGMAKAMRIGHGNGGVLFSSMAKELTHASGRKWVPAVLALEDDKEVIGARMLWSLKA